MNDDTIDHAADYNPVLKPVMLDLFTEIAILEHLIRKWLEPLHLGDVDAAEFGVLNFFCRLNKTEERLSGLAWCFQVELSEMSKPVEAMVARGYLAKDNGNDPVVSVTPAGKAFHAELVEDMAPVIAPVVEEIAAEDLRTTARTLMEIRRTLENLPDR